VGPNPGRPDRESLNGRKKEKTFHERLGPAKEKGLIRRRAAPNVVTMRKAKRNYCASQKGRLGMEDRERPGPPSSQKLHCGTGREQRKGGRGKKRKHSGRGWRVPSIDMGEVSDNLANLLNGCNFNREEEHRRKGKTRFAGNQSKSTNCPERPVAPRKYGGAHPGRWRKATERKCREFDDVGQKKTENRHKHDNGKRELEKELRNSKIVHDLDHGE